MTNIVTRFAPSPTGEMHLGNVRTALLNWLYARQHGGRFLLRFEDTDQDRSQQVFVDSIKQDLQWLGLNWDGEALFQSAHAPSHRKVLNDLAEQGSAYRCFCSESQLSIDRKLATSRGLPPRYAGRCRSLTKAESDSRSQSESFVWRLAVHAEQGDVVVSDILRGDVLFVRRDLDDPVVVRSDGSFTFLLPNAIDDALDGITHAMRGDDHLTNSAYQVWMLQQLALNVPAYLHHGLLLGADGAKLSKRTGSHSVVELNRSGLLPEALIQSMARLGHPNLPDDVAGLDALAKVFRADQVSTSAVKWSDDEMWRWHTRLLHKLDIATLTAMLVPMFEGEDDKRLQEFSALIAGNMERIEDARAFQRLLDVSAPLEDEVCSAIQAAGADFFSAAEACLESSGKLDWRNWSQSIKEQTGCKGKELFMPLRAALTGTLHGPEMSAVVQFLGRDGVKERIHQLQESLA
ncbi:MAG: glutamate--tRNA ligase [Zetaproteobacteria bacterium CG_4_9_14_3_um_filter_49_83]|nr:MAG: glutamate--tRNA ligase [Zetaproteobacteria bacterium CG1_02_49_23]PIQ32742.1 MAG: glutamate--tRNA ligase [Zetaproteobacteria bacterium CG17_big_fil_post_rev_8_21_14_2_50_50_13]PIV29607.1 MAG: glutamate--tRNA ligase [Zetaproteobacteria bacterium CG02_land_8_20_14_3_00_50_9]PIY54945.1 MAG: glutamate--tRNA ligase [Zetaproteobacteria bacterium CG_4_10_14_0_8_um_filter_49_80]PJA35310.1 MAG: glutamate--tRNA ligase [Zetaproteobacteria bacterium CG_4_9_14_3_um_filter_49_83]